MIPTQSQTIQLLLNTHTLKSSLNFAHIPINQNVALVCGHEMFFFFFYEKKRTEKKEKKLNKKMEFFSLRKFNIMDDILYVDVT